MGRRGLVVMFVATVFVASACGGGAPARRPGGATSPAAVTTAIGHAPAVQFETAFPHLPLVARPTALIEVPGQDWMLLEVQDGRILGFPKNAAAASYTTVWDNRDHTSRQGNEEGLLGLAIDPAFATNGYMYVYYSASSGERHTVLSRLATRGSGASLMVVPGSELQILQQAQPYSNHKGGQVAFGPDGMLYLGFGDGGGGGDPAGNGQDITRNWLGSIIRIDVRQATAGHTYVVPPDNPFANGANGARPETWAYGLRNPWRFSFDARTGDMWIADVGEAEWEEVDRGQAGANYGWSTMEGDHCYRPSSGCDRSGLLLPVAEYNHEGGRCSITGGFVYRGAEIPALDGDYVFADYCSGMVQAFPAADAREGGTPHLTTLRANGPEVTSFAQDAGGELYLLEFDGTIQRLAAG